MHFPCRPVNYTLAHWSKVNRFAKWIWNEINCESWSGSDNRIALRLRLCLDLDIGNWTLRLRDISPTRSKKNFQPFSGNLSNNLKSLIHRKHRLWNRWISSRKEAVYNEYKVTRNKVKSEMAKLLRQEQERISVDCKKNEIILAVYQ